MNPFHKFLFDNVPKYDRLILKDFEPVSLLNVATVKIGWWDTRESVRRISEGLHYNPSGDYSDLIDNQAC